MFASNFIQSVLKLQHCIKMIVITNDWLVMRTWETDPGLYLHKGPLCIIYFVVIYSTTAQYHLICTYFNHYVNLSPVSVWTTFMSQMKFYFNSNLWEWLFTGWNIMTSYSVVHSWCVFRGDGAQASQRCCPTTPPTACLISGQIFMLSVLKRLAPSTCHALSTLGARAAQEMASLLPCT